MTTENLSDVVYISKNANKVAELQNIPSRANGEMDASSYLCEGIGDSRPNVPVPECKAPADS